MDNELEEFEKGHKAFEKVDESILFLHGWHYDIENYEFKALTQK